MKILIVEDDYHQIELLIKSLRNEFTTAIFEEPIRTESEFYIRFPDIIANTPDIVLMDIMLRWADASDNIPIPPENVREEGFYRAGFRCQKMLENDIITKDIPIILYTMLSKDNLEKELNKIPENVFHITKEFNSQSILKQYMRKIFK